jgi:putative transposase
MSRPPRPNLPGIPQHVVQRGNNRLPCFLDDDDRRFYLAHLNSCLSAQACALHAYVLMDNHVHLLLTPTTSGAISRLMQNLGGRYSARFNARHERTGSLWEGRFRACLVDSDRYLLACHRYIESNPVRAGMVARPQDFPWSSHRANALGSDDPLLTPHSVLTELGADAESRRRAYRHLFAEEIPTELAENMRLHLRQRAAWGSEAFQRDVASRIDRFAGVRPAHRPLRRHQKNPA